MISYADLFEDDWKTRGIEFTEEEESPSNLHHYPTMLKNMLNRVDNFGGNMGLQSNFSRVAAKGKKVKLEEPATSGESGSDSEDSAVYDMGDQFIDDMDRVDLGTQEDFKRVKDEGFYVISEPFLSHIYS